MGEQGGDVSQRGRELDGGGGADEGVCPVPTALEPDADHRPAPPAEQRHGPVVIGVVGPTGVQDRLDPRQRGQLVGQPPRRRFRPVVPHLEGVQPPFRQPAIERRRRESPGHGGIADRSVRLGRIRHRISERHVRMPGEHLRDRMHHDVGPVFERPQGPWGGECVVHNHGHSPAGGDGGDAVDVGDPQCRIRDGLDQDQSRIRPDGLFDGGRVGRIGERRLEPETTEISGQQAM